MRAYALEPLTINPIPVGAAAAKAAYAALADAAGMYLDRLLGIAGGGANPGRAALITRIRGTGPGASFGDLVARIQDGLEFEWQTPFEGSHNVSGAVLEASRILGCDRDDGFLLLRFAAGTLDLPLHTHELSERFICVLEGRGLYHVAPDPLKSVAIERVRHVPVRSRDVLMFTRGVVHTFSTDTEPLTLLSYHRPYIPLEDQGQYRVSDKPLLPRDFLAGVRGRVSFDAGWTSLM